MCFSVVESSVTVFEYWARSFLLLEVGSVRVQGLGLDCTTHSFAGHTHATLYGFCSYTLDSIGGVSFHFISYHSRLGYLTLVVVGLAWFGLTRGMDGLLSLRLVVDSLVFALCL